MSYKSLKIWQQAHKTVLLIHHMSRGLPSFENYEEGQQIRRSSKSTKSCIVEGYGRRRYRLDWIKFLVYALASNDESIDHLDNLWETGSLKDELTFLEIKSNPELLGKQLNLFLQAIESRR